MGNNFKGTQEIEDKTAIFMTQQLHRAQRTICPYTILGLEEASPREVVDAAYEGLKHKLSQEHHYDTPQSWVQAQQALMAVEDAYSRIVSGDVDDASESGRRNEGLSPKLGQMLVAAGLITLEQLEEAIRQQTTVHLPLGEILKGSSLLTQMELDNYLLNQRLIKLPEDSPYLIGQRLIGLGLITEDMLRIALVEQRNTGKMLGQILVDRCWLSQEILTALVA